MSHPTNVNYLYFGSGLLHIDSLASGAEIKCPITVPQEYGGCWCVLFLTINGDCFAVQNAIVSSGLVANCYLRNVTANTFSNRDVAFWYMLIK
jgi:hypothetical protein